MANGRLEGGLINYCSFVDIDRNFVGDLSNEIDMVMEQLHSRLMTGLRSLQEQPNAKILQRYAARDYRQRKRQATLH